ncbi:uncharacterized protein PG998_004557 [Apiospora kogelbergensis]|uniref:uncharacterized protein n=1 Tax=Apiospora kogelbergensis TaxID=1337665 RepID=UPI00312D9A78
MSLPSAPQPPEWYLEQDKGPSILAAIITVTVIGTIFTVTRLYVRQFIRGKLMADDYLILISMLCGYVSVAFGVLAVKSGNGKHFIVLSTEQKEGVIFWTMVGFVPGIFSFAIPKFAVVVLLCRLLEPSRLHRIVLWAMTGLCVTVLTSCIFTLFFQCSPPSSQWNFSITEKSCMDKWIHIDYSIAVGVGTVRKKIGLSVALGIGSIASIIAIYKCTRISTFTSPDFSYDCPDLIIWTVATPANKSPADSVEGNSLITATCIPILKPLGDKLMGSRVFSSNDSKRRHYDPDNKPPSQGPVGSKDMELSTQSRWRRRKGGGIKDPDADLLVTTFHDRAETESQENILAAQKGSRQQNNRDSAMKEEKQGVLDDANGRASSSAADGISKTNVVVVTYGEGQTGDSWRKGEEFTSLEQRPCIDKG